MRQESLVYGYQDLFADFGGYLGLFIGASILSIYDNILELATKLRQILKNSKETPAVAN